MHSRICGCLVALAAIAAIAATANAAAGLALTPPRGFNSWDGFNWMKGYFNEEEFRQIAETQAKELLPFGYEFIVIDEFWYSSDAGTPDSIDEYGRAVPNVTAWPSAAGGKGFKPLADWTKSLGLKLGIHVMHSVPMAAIRQKTQIMNGGGATADQISVSAPCPWNKNWFGADTSHKAAQAYFDSVYQLYADWGIDLIKNDCTFATNMDATNINAVNAAMDKTGHDFVYSLSPGQDATLQQARNISGLVNMYRITGDWHGPEKARGCGPWEEHLQQAAIMQSEVGAPGHKGKSWPDLDMLAASMQNDNDHLFEMSLWSIMRSPLFIGMDFRNQTADNLWWYTNEEVLAVQANSTNNRAVTNTTEAGQGCTRIQTAVFAADSAQGGTTYVALLNPSHQAREVSATFKQLGIQAGSCQSRDLWTKSETDATQDKLSVTVAAGAGTLYSLHSCN